MADLNQAAQASSAAPAQAAASNPAQTNSESKKLTKYKCVTKCYWKGQLYNEGDNVTVPSGTKIPSHFAKA